MIFSRQNNFRFLLLLIITSVLVGCGVGKFFIERAINNMERDIADEFNDYADFTETQSQQLDDVAKRIAMWVRVDRLPALAGQLEMFAHDIEHSGRLSETTWVEAMRLLENPMQLSLLPNAVESIADLLFRVDAQQIEDVIDKLREDHEESFDEFKDHDFDEQNKRFTKALKTVFAELGIDRSKTQLAHARTMLGKRKDHSEVEWLNEQATHQKLIQLITDQNSNQQIFVGEFTRIWIHGERSLKQLAPEAWQHNSEITFAVLNYLMEDLTRSERELAASNIRQYVALFTRLSGQAATD